VSRTTLPRCVMQRVAVCCGVLQCDAVYTHKIASTVVGVCCSMLQCDAVHLLCKCFFDTPRTCHTQNRLDFCCSVLQYVAVCCSAQQRTYFIRATLTRLALVTHVIATIRETCAHLLVPFAASYACVAVCCSMMQCVTVCCSVLQCVIGCRTVLQCVAECCSVLQSVAVCCSVLQSVAVCCSVLQCVAVCC